MKVRKRAPSGACLREARKQKGLSINQAAAAAGVSPQHLVNWENGYHQPKVERLIQFSRLYGVSVEALLGVLPEMA